MKVFFECDGMGCEGAQKIGKCPNPDDCRMTTDAKHAANFHAVKDTSGELYVFERKSTDRDFDIAKKIIDAIEDTTWYHIERGELFMGANGKEDEPLYKARDIFDAITSVVSEYDEEVEDDR